MTHFPLIVRDIRTLQEWSHNLKMNGESLGFVPTMGALHEGHLSLISEAKKRCDRTAVSIFVNPAQFAPTEDFEAYPRTEKRDLQQLRDLGVDTVFAPNGAEMYAADHSTSIHPNGPALGLETDFRPDFFNGVALVVTKLLLAALPDIAVFGEKDYQQLLVIKKLVDDLNIPVRIIGAPTVREADGLALSSRNAYLSSEHRQIAPKLASVMMQVVSQIKQEHKPRECLSEGCEQLREAGFKIDYLELRDAETLRRPADDFSGPRRLLAATWLGNTRLIDNMSA
ncbi:MAG: pantoate--beta-alanine ligase [Stappiaceae bacterium]